MSDLFLKSFVQRNRKPTEKKQRLLENNKCLITDYDSVKQDLQNYKKINLEIGFGRGEFLLKHALLYPQELFIGSEPFLSGVMNVLQCLKDDEIPNIRVFNDDARILMSQIESELFDKIFILFPDPWPKARHNKRRVINQFLLDKLYQLLKWNGQIHIVTDSDDYSEWIAELLMKDNRYKILSSENKVQIADLNTSYYRKAKERHHQIHVFGVYKSPD